MRFFRLLPIVLCLVLAGAAAFGMTGCAAQGGQKMARGMRRAPNIIRNKQHARQTRTTQRVQGAVSSTHRFGCAGHW